MNGYIITIENFFTRCNEAPFRVQLVDADRGCRIEQVKDFRHIREAEVYARNLSARYGAPVRSKRGNCLYVYKYKTQY